MSKKHWKTLLERAVVSQLAFPLSSWACNRTNVTRTARQLLESEYLDESEIRRIQVKKLQVALDRANRYVPFYRQRFREIGMDPRDIRRIEDLERVPPLTRGELRERKEDLIDVRLRESVQFADQRTSDPGTPLFLARFRKHRLIRNTSSGSTGAPTVFYEDGFQTALNWALEMRLKAWFGVPLLAREARLVKASRDYDLSARSVTARRLLWNQLVLPGTNLSSEDFELILREIQEYKPQVIYGFPSAIAGLADYLRRTGKRLESWRPDMAVGWAGPVYEHEEAVIRKHLGCAVSNNYGSREVGHVAGKCPYGTFHINDEHMLVETVKTEQCSASETAGEILVTGLDPSPMPMIRYAMGDVGRVVSAQCPCRRNLRVLSEFMGRTGEIFITRDGHIISPNFWCRFFFVPELARAIRRFQVVYRRDGDIKLMIVRDDGYTSDSEQFIRRQASHHFTPETGVEIEYRDEIAPLLSGKYQMVVKEQAERI